MLPSTAPDGRILRQIDADGDGIVSVREYNQTHPCQSADKFYDCEAGVYATKTWSLKEKFSLT